MFVATVKDYYKKSEFTHGKCVQLEERKICRINRKPSYRRSSMRPAYLCCMSRIAQCIVQKLGWINENHITNYK